MARRRREKLDFDGEYYRTETARLYSPPVHRIPLLIAAGGTKTARFAGETADGLITSVKDPGETNGKVIAPFQDARGASTATSPGVILATRWTILATNADDAWTALSSMRGLRAPGRLEVSDPAVLRERADAMDRDEILGKYVIARNARELADAYTPLLADLGADYVSIQVASADPINTIKLIGAEVLPALRNLARSAQAAGSNSAAG